MPCVMCDECQVVDTSRRGDEQIHIVYVDTLPAEEDPQSPEVLGTVGVEGNDVYLIRQQVPDGRKGRSRITTAICPIVQLARETLDV